MKVEFSMSSEERQDIIEIFQQLINEHPVESRQDLTNIISSILLNILNSAKDSVIRMCAECIKETLEESPIYQDLISRYGEQEVWEGSKNEESSVEDSSLVAVDVGESSDEVQKILDAWNEAIKRKEYVLAERKYKS